MRQIGTRIGRERASPSGATARRAHRPGSVRTPADQPAWSVRMTFATSPSSAGSSGSGKVMRGAIAA